MQVLTSVAMECFSRVIRLLWLTLVYVIAAYFLLNRPLAAAVMPETAKPTTETLGEAKLLVLQDPSAALTVDSVLQQHYPADFTPLEGSYLSAGFTDAAIWLKLPMPKVEQQTALWLSLGNPLLQNISLYRVDNMASGPIATLLQRGGVAEPAVLRKLMGSTHYFAITLEPSDSAYYLLRLSSSSSLSLPISLITQQEKEQRLRNEHLWFGLVIGLLLLLIFYNLLVALLTRCRANLIYTGFLTFILTLFAVVSGLGASFLWPNHALAFKWLIPLSLSLVSFFSYRFALEYFQGQAQQGFTTAIRWLAWASLLLLATMWLLSYPTATKLAMANALLMVLVLLVFAIKCRLQHLPGADIFLIGRLFILAGGLVQFLKTMALIPAYYLVEYILFVGAIAEGIVLSMGLALKAAWSEQQRQAAELAQLAEKNASLTAIASLNQQLESEVKERRQSEQVQATLFKISELAAGNEALGPFLRQVNQALSELLLAKNFFVALYDKAQHTIQFPYMADEKGQDVPDPNAYIPADQLKGSWSMWIIEHGQPLYGNAEQITAKSGLAPRFGSVAQYWLGLPLFNEQQVFGVLCLQIYDQGMSYSEDERRLLEYVSRHISQSLQRKQYRRQLEQQVAERTEAYRQSVQQIKTLLDNTGQGFLTFDRELTIAPDYSKACLTIFQTTALTGKVVTWLAANDAKLQALYEETLAEVFDPAQTADMVSVYLSLLPQERVFFNKRYQIAYRKIAPEQIMVILSDITEQTALQQALQAQQQQANFVVYALLHPEEVKQTLLSFQQLMTRLPDLCREPDHDMLQMIYREIHTFKSLLAQILCPHLPALLHALETELQQQLALPSATPILQHLDETYPLQERLDEVFALLKQCLGGDYFLQEQRVVVPMSLLQQIVPILTESQPELALALRQIQYTPLAHLLSGHFATAERIALEQGKQLAPIHYKGAAVHLDAQYYQPLLDTLVHLFRNAVDHGIESPWQREECGKTAEATIHCIGTMQDHTLHLQISDDGQGLVPALIRQQALNRGLLTEQAECSAHELAQYIFNEGFSTKTDVTTLSGRGIGLAAVRHACARYQASISVYSEPGEGCRFELILPLAPDSYLLA